MPTRSRWWVPSRSRSWAPVPLHVPTFWAVCAGSCASGRAVRGETRGGHEDGADNAGGDCGCDACIPAHDVFLTCGEVVTGCDQVPPKLAPVSATRLKRVCRLCGDAGPLALTPNERG